MSALLCRFPRVLQLCGLQDRIASFIYFPDSEIQTQNFSVSLFFFSAFWVYHHNKTYRHRQGIVF